MSEKRRLQAIVSGEVQGVGFRFFTQRLAQQLHVTGFVRNEPDDRVLVQAQASEPVLQEFLQELARGPVSAHVDDVQVFWMKPDAEEREFQIRFGDSA